MPALPFGSEGSPFAGTLALLDGLPPLRQLAEKYEGRGEARLARLAPPHLCLLAAVLLASPVRLATTQRPGMRPSTRPSTATSTTSDQTQAADGGAGGSIGGSVRGSVGDRGRGPFAWAELAVVPRSPAWHFDRLEQQHGHREAFHG